MPLPGLNPGNKESQKEEYIPGYPLELFVDGVEDRIKCGFCDLIVRSPMQSFCGHRFCLSCVKEIQHSGETVRCKPCVAEGLNEVDSIFHPDQTFLDNAISKEMLKKNIKCPNEGCTFKGILRTYLAEGHEKRCQFRSVPCTGGCGNLVPLQKMQEHLRKSCPAKLKVTCGYCKSDVIVAEKEVHMSTCPSFPVTCSYCGKEEIPRDQYSSHLDRECQKLTGKRPQPCPLGCNEMIDMERFDEHLATNLGKHFKILAVAVNDIRSKTSFQQGGAEGGASPRSPVNDQLAGKLMSLEAQIKGASMALTQHGMVVEQVPPLIQMTKILETSISTLKLQMEGYDELLQERRSTFEADKKYQAENEKLMTSLQRTLAIKDIALAEQDLRIKNLENAFYEGMLVWKIDDFDKKLENAKNGTTMSFYSPCFYTSRTGYKMCARIYLNGDGIGKGSHISLFFVLMRGKYDALLRWPFRQKVTFMILDQEKREHILDAFNPDPQSLSFRRPTSDMNVASGCPLFVPIAHIFGSTAHPGYVKNDTMFIKVIVDTSDLH